MEWNTGQPLSLPGDGGWLDLVAAPAGLDPARLRSGTVTVRFRRGGERLRAHAGGPHRQLKHLLAEAGVPPWERGRIPLLYVADTLVAAGDVLVDAEWVVSPGLLPTVTA